jgi:hypothetical protein
VSEGAAGGSAPLAAQLGLSWTRKAEGQGPELHEAVAKRAAPRVLHAPSAAPGGQTAEAGWHYDRGTGEWEWRTCYVARGGGPETAEERKEQELQALALEAAQAALAADDYEFAPVGDTCFYLDAKEPADITDAAMPEEDGTIVLLDWDQRGRYEIAYPEGRRPPDARPSDADPSDADPGAEDGEGRHFTEEGTLLRDASTAAGKGVALAAALDSGGGVHGAGKRHTTQLHWACAAPTATEATLLATAKVLCYCDIVLLCTLVHPSPRRAAKVAGGDALVALDTELRTPLHLLCANRALPAAALEVLCTPPPHGIFPPPDPQVSCTGLAQIARLGSVFSFFD